MSVFHLDLQKTCPCLETNQSHPQNPNLSPRSILILTTHLCLLLPSDLFPSGFPTNTLYALFFYYHICAECPTNLILLDLIILKTTNHEGPCYAVFFTIPSLHTSLVQIFSSAPSSQTHTSIFLP
jgi:hypothetical protein